MVRFSDRNYWWSWRYHTGFSYYIGGLGVVVGILSVGKDDTTGFLVFAIGLAAVSGGIDAIPVLGGYVNSILGNVSALVNAAAVVVVIRCVVSMTCLSSGGDDEDSA